MTIPTSSIEAAEKTLRQLWLERVLKRSSLLIEELKKIPHLKIDLEFNPEPLHQELLRIDQFAPQELNRPKTPEMANYYHGKWHARSLIGVTADSWDTRETASYKMNERQMNEDGSFKYYVTDLGAQMPETMGQLHRIGDNPGRSRVSKIFPGQATLWHSHCQAFNYTPIPYTFVIVHLPVTTNPGVAYEVSYLGRHQQTDPVWPERYPPGQVWILNGWHDHRAINLGDTERLSVFTYFNLDDEKLLAHIERAVGCYMGPKVE